MSERQDGSSLREGGAFEKAVHELLKWEGGYVNDPADPGGETNFGISKRSYPRLDIRNLTRQQAIEIYRTDWWNRHKLHVLPETIGPKVLDIGVNAGMPQAVRCLQRAVNRARQGVDLLTVDGRLGPATHAAVQACDEDTLLEALRHEHAQFYHALVAKRPPMKRFLNGWLRRAKA